MNVRFKIKKLIMNAMAIEYLQENLLKGREQNISWPTQTRILFHCYLNDVQ
jgi:hypothetical protein